ncbi:hypothetical protein LSH36_1665g00008 [Paralvinella palmiformis]|uniref:FAM124 domain-containing protein n=1 Tax=Paralvinella palmiformis TaxID=53620 RepID=A0AAD9ISP3_9ANNE|nr:hypothetical protein LSH36_1665g00008 [Paralvinella palmiformis]
MEKRTAGSHRWWTVRGVQTTTHLVSRTERQRVQCARMVHSCHRCVERGTSAKSPFCFVYPRNRRASSSEQSTSSGFSSCSSPEGQVGVKHGGGSLDDHDQRQTMAECSMASLQSTHAHKAVAHAQCGHSACKSLPSSRGKVKVYIRVQGESDETCLRQIYKPILDMIDQNTDVIDFIDDVTMDGGGKWPLLLFGGCKDTSGRPRGDVLVTPSLAIVLLIQEKEIVGADRLEDASRYFRKPPWKFHHSEWVAAHRIRAYPYNSLDYFSVADELPVCSVRQVHGSKEHLRLQRYVSHENWPDTLNLYKLIIDRNPDYHKSDFCVFTVEMHRQYTVQFALKRLPKGISVSLPCHTVLNFQVSDACALVPLLPHSCQKLSDTRWQTTDLDGNELFLEVVSAKRRTRQRPRSRTKSQGSRRSVSSTSSFASILLDTAKEFIEAEESSSASVFSEPYVFQRRNEFCADESSSSSVAHSVLGFESSRGHLGETGIDMSSFDETRPQVQPISGNGTPGDDFGTQLAPADGARSPGDIGDVRATPDHRRFAWVREMLEVDSGLAPRTGRPGAGRIIANNRRHSHQHTDSGFAEDKSDESGDRNNHRIGFTGCRQINCRRDEENISGQCFLNGDCHRGAFHDNTDDEEGVDLCDREIERLRLYQSNPDISPATTKTGSRSGSVLSQTSADLTDCGQWRRSEKIHDVLSNRRIGDVLPNKLTFAPPLYSRGGHVTPDVHGVENVRATSCVPRDVASPGFGRIPPRCTSTPLAHSPAFRAASSSGSDGNPELKELQLPYNQTASLRNGDCRRNGKCFDERPRGRHKPGLPPLPKPKRDANAYRNKMDLPASDNTQQRINNDISAFVAVQPQFKTNADVNRTNDSVGTIANSQLRVTAEVHSAHLASQTCQVNDRECERGRNSGGNGADPEYSFEEAAIDCPPSLVTRCVSTDVKNTSTGHQTAVRHEQGHLAENVTNNTPSEPRYYSATSLPRPRSVSKMVTFAEEVQERDISICMDDVSETSRDWGNISKVDRGTDKDPATMGFWI